MNKQFKSALIFVAVTLSLITGCSDKTPKTDDININNVEDKLNSMSDNELADAISDAADKLDNSVENNTNSDSSVEEEKYELFPVADGWKDADLRKMNVQIDDVLYTPGISAEDFIKQLGSSSVEYEFSYDPDKVVPENGQESILVNRNGKEWFSATAFNPSSETATLSSLPIISIIPGKNATPYCRFIDGRSNDELSAMKYDDVKALSSVFNELGFKYTEEKGMIDHQIEPKYKLSCYDAPSFADWTGYSICTDVSYNFYTSNDTSDFHFSFPSVFMINSKKIEE